MRPLVNVSYALDRAIWPWQLVGHHLTSVLLHVLNVLLVFQLAWNAASDQRSHAPPGPPERVSPQVVAFMAASLFGLHPLMTEAVGYISGRSEVLYACFFLLALLSARRWMIGEGAKWMVLATGLWAAALMSKEVAVFWPIVASLHDRYVLGSPEASWRRRFVRVYMPMLGLTVAAGVIRVGILVLVENPGEAHVMWQFIPVELVVWFKYFRLLLLPTGQTIFHQIEPIHSPFDPELLAAAAWIAIWVGLGLRLRRRNGLLALGLFWFILLLIPSSMLVLLDLGEPMAEHRVLLQRPGCFLAFAHGLGVGVGLHRQTHGAVAAVAPLPDCHVADRAVRDDRPSQRGLGLNGRAVARGRGAVPAGLGASHAAWRCAPRTRRVGAGAGRVSYGGAAGARRADAVHEGRPDAPSCTGRRSGRRVPGLESKTGGSAMARNGLAPWRY